MKGETLIDYAKKPHWSLAGWLPLLFIAALWIIHYLNTAYQLKLSRYAILPRELWNLPGIAVTPLLHGSTEHLFNNSVPLLVLGWALFYFYKEMAFKTVLWIWLMSGIWLWVAGRPSYHIGASGLVYGLAAFLFVSGWLRKEKRGAALSLLVAFLYGSLWWGIMPIDDKMSWEGHLTGAFAGLTLAIAFRKQGVQKERYHWEMDETVDLETWDGMVEFEEVTGLETYPPKPIRYPRPPRFVKYEYKPRKKPLP